MKSKRKSAAPRHPSVRLEHAGVDVRVGVRVDQELAGRPGAGAVQLRLQIDVRRGARPLDHGVGVEHAAQRKILGQRELGQAVELEFGDHHRRVDAAGRRPQLRLEAQAAVIAESARAARG